MPFDGKGGGSGGGGGGGGIGGGVLRKRPFFARGRGERCGLGLGEGVKRVG